MIERPITGQETWAKVAARRLRLHITKYVEIVNAGGKFCGGCRTTLPRSDTHFAPDTRRADGFRSRCRACIKRQKRQHYDSNRDSERARQLAYQQANRPKLYAYNARWSRNRNALLRAEMLAAYGGRCVCCGEDEPIFLDLDHIENDGAAHRREVGNNTQVMVALKRAGWPRDRFQILCCNCNQGKARNGGICPHQQREARCG